MNDAVRVFVTVGTDHHHFDRLIGWVDDWDPPGSADVEVLVQHGSSRPARTWRSVPFLGVDVLAETLAAAHVFVTQGGPGSIMDARRAGRIPLVVARRAALAEVVDDHQITFVEYLARRGALIRVDDAEGLYRALDAAVQSPDSLRCAPLGDTAAHASAAVSEAVAELVSAHRSLPRWSRRLPGPRRLLPR